ncbi:hypothetical protein LXL04_030556 [Taraxacum kok-saghyz]
MLNRFGSDRSDWSDRMGADQYADEKSLVDELDVGKRVSEGRPDNVPDSVELARLLERVKVKEVSQATNKAAKEGTSIRDLDMLTKVLSQT